MAQEAKYLERLRNSIRYEIIGDRLTLSDKTGAHQLLFKAAK